MADEEAKIKKKRRRHPPRRDSILPLFRLRVVPAIYLPYLQNLKSAQSIMIHGVNQVNGEH